MNARNIIVSLSLIPAFGLLSNPSLAQTADSGSQSSDQSTASKTTAKPVQQQAAPHVQIFEAGAVGGHRGSAEVVGSNGTGEQSAESGVRSPRHQRAKQHHKVTWKYDPNSKYAKEPWYQFISAGEIARGKGDTVSAKKYLFAALSEFETSKKFDHLNGAAAYLEARIQSLYPRDWDNSDLALLEKQKLQEEQVAVVSRLVRLNQKWGDSAKLTLLVTSSSLQKANTALQKTKDEIKEQSKQSASAVNVQK